jgi:hypothetical protein
MKIRVLTAALLASLAVAAPAFAAPIIASNVGIATPAQTISFDELVFPANTLITNQYAALGVTFNSGLRYSPQAGFPNITGNTLGNFSPMVQGPYTISFSSLQSSVAFAMVSNGSGYTFQSFLGASLVENFNSAIGSSSASNFYGFSGSNFDSIRITSNSNDSFLIDNLKLSSVGAVPEPTTWMMMLLGMVGIGFAMRRKSETTLRVRYT